MKIINTVHDVGGSEIYISKVNRFMQSYVRHDFESFVIEFESFENITIKLELTFLDDN